MCDYKVLELVRKLCKVIAEGKLDSTTICLILKRPLLLGAEVGVCEIVEEIIKSYPDAIWFTNEKNQNLFHLAIINRQEKVFNLIYRLNDRKHLLLTSEDGDKNNILHLAGKLAPENRLNVIPGAALQMQFELLWFKEIEKIVPPAYKADKNCIGETPAMIFTKAHRELVKEGRDWMKVVANSCSVAAALIATIVFAAAITVPGDYNDAGIPNFYKQIAFTTFSVSDAVSFFSSIAAIIMFLSILTARYAEDDFLYVLPKRLIWGLVMLFLSLTSLMVAFCATVFLVFCDRKAYWILAPMFVSALVPLYLFTSSEFPLVWDLMVSTYGSGIIRKERTFYEIIKEKGLKLVF
ncbi:hypothetical protein Pint_11981 [Pistacia integerrima]|uniref:Uncharacterized protein n=1 Tax=Pistacia integerrima TaxID=434235 RepID=A0ACC0XG62_9ROSI|nr:hypothetical protein Pint_11981 [Pistacia integerrima]